MGESMGDGWTHTRPMHNECTNTSGELGNYMRDPVYNPMAGTGRLRGLVGGMMDCRVNERLHGHNHGRLYQRMCGRMRGLMYVHAHGRVHERSCGSLCGTLYGRTSGRVHERLHL